MKAINKDKIKDLLRREAEGERLKKIMKKMLDKQKEALQKSVNTSE